MPSAASAMGSASSRSSNPSSALTRADAAVVRSRRRVEEAALAHRTPLLLEACGALVLQHEEGLGLAVPVVEAVRLGGREDADVAGQGRKVRHAVDTDRPA